MNRRSNTPPRKRNKGKPCNDEFKTLFFLLLWYIGLIICGKYDQNSNGFLRNTAIYVFLTFLCLLCSIFLYRK